MITTTPGLPIPPQLYHPPPSALHPSLANIHTQYASNGWIQMDPQPSVIDHEMNIPEVDTNNDTSQLAAPRSSSRLKTKPSKKVKKVAKKSKSDTTSKPRTTTGPLTAISSNTTHAKQPSTRTPSSSAVFLDHPVPFANLKNANVELLPAPPGAILDVNNLLILHPPQQPLNIAMAKAIKSPYNQYHGNQGNGTFQEIPEDYTSPWEMYTCRVCRRTYDGRNSRSIARRHLQDKHGISLKNQPRRSRWDCNPERPKTSQEAEERTLSSKRQWAMKNRQKVRLEKTHSDILEPFGPKGLEIPGGIRLVAPLFRGDPKPRSKKGTNFVDGSLGKVEIPPEIFKEIRSLKNINGESIDDMMDDQQKDGEGGPMSASQPSRKGRKMKSTSASTATASTSCSSYPKHPDEVSQPTSHAPTSATRSTVNPHGRLTFPPRPPQPVFQAAAPHAQIYRSGPQYHNQAEYGEFDASTRYRLQLTDPLCATIEVIFHQGNWSINSRLGVQIGTRDILEAVGQVDQSLMANGIQPDYSTLRRLYFVQVPFDLSRPSTSNNTPALTQGETFNDTQADLGERELSPDSSEIGDEPSLNDHFQSDTIPHQVWVQPEFAAGEIDASERNANNLVLLDQWYRNTVESAQSYYGSETLQGVEGKMTTAAEGLLDLRSSPIKVSREGERDDEDDRETGGYVQQLVTASTTLSSTNQDTDRGDGDSSNQGMSSSAQWFNTVRSSSISYSTGTPTHIQNLVQRSRSKTVGPFPLSRPEAPHRFLSAQHITPLGKSASLGCLDDPFILSSPFKGDVVSKNGSDSNILPSSSRRRTLEAEKNGSPLDKGKKRKSQTASDGSDSGFSGTEEAGPSRIPLGRVKTLPHPYNLPQGSSSILKRYKSDNTDLVTFGKTQPLSSTASGLSTTPSLARTLSTANTSSSYTTPHRNLTNTPVFGSHLRSSGSRMMNTDRRESDAKSLSDRWLVFSSPAGESPSGTGNKRARDLGLVPVYFGLETPGMKGVEWREEGEDGI